MFITFEGSEGTGKSTQIAHLAKDLQLAGYPVLLTREPGGTPIGVQIRRVLSDLQNTDMQKRTEILLFQASRSQLVDQVIRPHLESGGIVLSDRYADSTLAYQGYGYQMELTQIRSIVNFATGGLKPNLTLLFDMDVEEGLRRRATGGEWNRLDAMELAFYQRVRRGYLELADLEPDRWVRIDASPPPEAVAEEVRRIVLNRFQANHQITATSPD